MNEYFEQQLRQETLKLKILKEYAEKNYNCSDGEVLIHIGELLQKAEEEIEILSDAKLKNTKTEALE